MSPADDPRDEDDDVRLAEIRERRRFLASDEGAVGEAYVAQHKLLAEDLPWLLDLIERHRGVARGAGDDVEAAREACLSVMLLATVRRNANARLDAFQAAIERRRGVAVPQDEVAAVARDARQTIAFLRSVVDSGESLNLKDRADLIKIYDRLFAIERRRGVAAPQAGVDEHRCISCRQVDEGPNATCTCMEPGPPCGICGEPKWEPLTPWKANDHWAEDGHEWVAVQAGGGDDYVERNVGLFQCDECGRIAEAIGADGMTILCREHVEQAGGGDEGATFLRERPDYIARREFHPLSDRWWRAFQAEPHEFAPDSWETFDEVVAWALANIPAQAGGGLRAALDEAVEVIRLYGLVLLPDGGYGCLACGHPSADREHVEHNEWCAAHEVITKARALVATPQGGKGGNG